MSVKNNDMRADQPFVSSFTGHSLEVCSVKWSPDGRVLASGGADNLVNIWELGRTTPLLELKQHVAAVKAMDWCPWQSNTLATGGGSSDRTIKIWDTVSGDCLKSSNAGSQVSSILWSKCSKEIISSHGFYDHTLSLWTYPSMMKRNDLKGHTKRVLCLALSPDGTTVVSAGADETARFWRIFDLDSKQHTSIARDYPRSNLRFR
jgi:cell division cycle protein 20 (cofactor of APC complex)